MNIGVMGGTFDPIHNGHLAVAEEARMRANLTEVLFLPAGQPWLKPERIVTAAEHRLEMVRLAIADRPYCKLSTMEIERSGPTYTVDTMVEMRAQLGAEDELFFLLGWDDLAQLPEWRNVTHLLELCYFVVAPRPGYPSPNRKSLDTVIPGLSQRVMLMDKPQIAVSASEIRERVARGFPITYLVPEPVNRYIKQHKLYISEQ